jgi:hypothetical protein
MISPVVALHMLTILQWIREKYMFALTYM